MAIKLTKMRHPVTGKPVTGLGTWLNSCCGSMDKSGDFWSTTTHSGGISFHERHEDRQDAVAYLNQHHDNMVSMGLHDRAKETKAEQDKFVAQNFTDAYRF